MSQYQVVAPLVIAKDQEGRPYHVYAGGVIQWLSDEQAAHLLGTGLVVEFGGDETPADSDDGGLKKPAANTKKDDLVEWIVANVSKDDGSDYTTVELNGLTKDHLWAIIDSVEV